MGTIPWVLLGVLTLLILFAVVLVLIIKKKPRPTDYYALFIMGIVWLGAGIPLKNYGLWTMGLIFTIVGLVHRDKWKQNRLRWDKLSPSEKKFKLGIIIALSILLLLGLVLFFLADQGKIKL